MAKLTRASTDFNVIKTKQGKSTFLDVSLRLNFVSSGNCKEFINDDGSVNKVKLFAKFAELLETSEEIKL